MYISQHGIIFLIPQKTLCALLRNKQTISGKTCLHQNLKETCYCISISKIVGETTWPTAFDLLMLVMITIIPRK